MVGAGVVGTGVVGIAVVSVTVVSVTVVDGRLVVGRQVVVVSWHHLPPCDSPQAGAPPPSADACCTGIRSDAPARASEFTIVLVERNIRQPRP